MTQSAESGGERRLPSTKTILDVIATVTLTVAAGLVIWTQLGAGGGQSAASPTRSIPLPEVPLAMDGAAAKGQTGAQVGLIGFSDFQCPYCGRFAQQVLPDLERDYISTGKLRLVFRHLPLGQHAAALPAAVAAECAGQQGRFWTLHDRLFAADPASLTIEEIRRLALSTGVKVPDFDVCAAQGTSTRVSRDVELARQLRVNSTPTFFVGQILPSGELRVAAVIAGARPIADFQREIDALLGPQSVRSRLKAFFSR